MSDAVRGLSSLDRQGKSEIEKRARPPANQNDPNVRVSFGVRVKQQVTLAAKVQIAATETLREISAVTREKIALNFLFTAANKLPFAQCRREICRVLFGNIVPVTFPQLFLKIFLQPQYVGHILRSLPTKWGFAWNWAVGENLESGLRS